MASGPAGRRGARSSPSAVQSPDAQGASRNAVPGGRGLFDGYEEFRSASGDDYKSVLLKGLVVPDTSVLLNLYRYSTRTRTQLLAAFAKLKTLWLPSQVQEEFWRNRLSVIRDSREITARTTASLEQKSRELTAIIGSWVNSRSADPAIKGELTVIVDSALQDLSARLAAITEADAADVPEDTNKDPVVTALDKLFAGNVGAPFDKDEYAAAIAEANRRLEAREPPGFRDRGKGFSPQGDYLAWRQILAEAGRRHSDVLFITSDQKDDWWRIGGGELLGPRGELVRELRAAGGGRLYLLTPERFLSRARDILDVEVSAESIADAERVDRRAADPREADWTEEQAAVLEGLTQSADSRLPIEQLPEGTTGSYLDVLFDMCQIARDAPAIDEYLNRFQDRYPKITVRSEARRRMSTLVKLGLATESSGQITLTDTGTDFTETKGIALVQAAFLARIRGARELLSIARNSDTTSLRAMIHGIPPEALTHNQATLIARWLEQLNLIEGSKDSHLDE
jgi:PIN like domain